MQPHLQTLLDHYSAARQKNADEKTLSFLDTLSATHKRMRSAQAYDNLSSKHSSSEGERHTLVFDCAQTAPFLNRNIGSRRHHLPTSTCSLEKGISMQRPYPSTGKSDSTSFQS
jgi:hypothetical protein